MRDWSGKEFHRVYCDESGCYNFLLHSTFWISVPAPSGVSPQMMTIVLNDPIEPNGAIDAATPRDLILAAPGTYNENVIMNKPVRLQGSGSGGTTIFAYPNPLEKLREWHNRCDALGARDFSYFLMKNPFSENEAPGIIVMGETQYQGGTLQNPLPETRTFNAGHPFNLPGQTLIDGFSISGSKASGAIFALTGTSHLVISNINATGNQGSYAGGIAIGTQDSGFDCNNDNVVIRYCKVHKNGGTQGPGGICMNEYAESYLVEHNLVWGNFSRFNGGGIGHRGVSPGNNVIQFNKIIFNNIVNNVAGLSGAGISLQDVAKANIANNTIANNDCTATSALARTAGQANLTPQPSGVVGARHSDLLVALFGTALRQTYSDPLLHNNIIWHNRSWYNDASLNGGQGGLLPRPGSPYWDLSVLGSTRTSQPHFAPMNCLLTSLTDPRTGFNYGVPGRDNITANPAFIAPYENQLRTATVTRRGRQQHQRADYSAYD